MSSSLQALLSRLRGVESRGKNVDLADYMEGLLDERKEADTQRPYTRDALLTPKQDTKLSKEKNGISSVASRVSIATKVHARSLVIDYDDIPSGLGSPIDNGEITPPKSVSNTLPINSEITVTSRLKAVTNNTRIPLKHRGQRSNLSVEAQREVDSVLRPNRGSVDIASEAESVLDRMSELSLAQQEQATAALMQDILRNSKLLSSGMAADTGTLKQMGTGALPVQLAVFKKGIDKLGKTTVRLPTITSLIDNTHKVPVPVTAGEMKNKSHKSETAGNILATQEAPPSALKKRISQMLPPTEEELHMAETILEKSTENVKRGQIYVSIQKAAVQEKRNQYQLAAYGSKPFASAGPSTPIALKASLSQTQEEEDQLLLNDDDAFLEAKPELADKLATMAGDARAALLEAAKEKVRQDRRVALAAEKKRELNDLRRQQEIKVQQEKAAREADVILFKNAEFQKDSDGNLRLDESSSAYFRTMAHKKKEAAIKQHMIARLEAEEAEAEIRAKNLANLQAQDEAIRQSRPGTSQESESIIRDEDGNIIESGSEDDDDEDDFADDVPIVSGLGSRLEGEVGSAKRKQSIAMLVQKSDSALVKHGSVEDLMAEMRKKVGVKGKRKKHKKHLVDSEQSTPKTVRIKDFLKSPIHHDTHTVPSRVVEKLPTDPSAMLKPKELVGGPLVVGTVNYGIPLGLQLHGSGRHKPLSMDDVASFQSILVESSAAIPVKLGVSELPSLTTGINVPLDEQPPSTQVQHPYASSSASTKIAVNSYQEPVRPVAAISEVDPNIFAGMNEVAEVKTVAEKVYAQVSNETKRFAKRILSSYSQQKTRFAVQTARVDQMESKSEEWMDAYKLALHDDLGVDIDATFLQRKLADRAIRLMMFYILEVQLKNAFTFLRDQTRRVTNARFMRAAALINRIGRGLVGRQYARMRAQKLKDRLDHERSTKYKRIRLENAKARIITRAIRKYAKMKTIKWMLFRRRAATTIQRRARGIQGRDYARRVRRWRDWLKINATMIQCAYRQRLARRRVVLYRKILQVRHLMAEWEAMKKVKMRQLQLVGASNTIKRYYRAYRVRVKIKNIIFWNRWGKAISLQRYVRGYYGRKLVKNLLRIKRAKEKRVFDAAQMMQKFVRGANARKLFAGMLHEKKKQRARRRMAKAKYLEDRKNLLDTSNLKRYGLSALRGLMPFRYLLLWSRALKIQRIYRGFRGRRVAFIRKIKTRIRKANALYFGKEKGAIQMQRIFRGFKVRRGLMRERRLDAAIKMQCFIRQYLARQVLTFHKVRRDAIQLLSRNIYLLLKFKKTMKNKFDNKRVAKQTIIIQRMWRHALKRKRMNRVKTDKRAKHEQASVIQSKITYILCRIQLRILMEAINRDLGIAIPFVACGLPCPALGPVQALFLSAVGPKANTKEEELLSNKLDNTSWSKWLAKIKGVTTSGRPGDSSNYRRQPIRFDVWQEMLRRQNKGVKPVERAKPEDISKQSTSRSKAAGRGAGGRGGRGRGGRGGLEAQEVYYEYCSFSLLESFMDGSIATLRGGNKTLSSTEIDMIFVKGKSDPSHQQLTYMEFLESVLAIAGEFYFDYTDEMKSAALADEEARARLAMKMQSEISSSQASLVGSENKEADLQDVDEDADSNSDGEKPVNEEAIKMLALMQKREAEKAKKKKRPETSYGAFNKESWRAKALMWEMSDILLTGKGGGNAPNIRMLMLLKMFDSCRQESWFIPVANWIELEARARLGMYCKRMQNMYWHMRAAFFRTLVKQRKQEKVLLALHNKTATVIQKYARRMVYKHRMHVFAQAFLIKYIPDIGHEYWYNPSTKITKYAKPAILGSRDCLSIPMPPVGLEFVVKCSNCTTRQATINCDECEDSYCRICFDDMHCKGTRRHHHRQKIPMCGYCKFQMACRTCMTCMTAKPEPGSPAELMSETDRGTMCDTCFTHTHNEHEIELRHASDEKKRALKQIAQSKSAYLVAHQLHLRIKTTHKYLDMVQSCEECWSRSAGWRCLDCNQVYCNRCLLGLHSLGGPFSKHKGEKLPYYTPEMHQSYLRDQRTQKFQTRMIEVNRLFEIKLKETKMKMILKIQSWWRMIRGRRVGRAHMLAVRKKIRRAYRERQGEEHIRNSWKYKVLYGLGFAPRLKSDTREESILRQISIFGKQRAREYIWTNRSDFGHYKEIIKTKNKVGRVVTKIKYGRKGIPVSGFDVGTLPELAQQARSGGYRLPGYVKIKAGESKFETTCDLSELLQPGMLVKLGPGYFKVRACRSNEVILDRTWRWAVPKSQEGVDRNELQNPSRQLDTLTEEQAKAHTHNEVMYRLPVYADEPRRLQYKFVYWASNYAISNPFSQLYFKMHNSLFTKVAGFGRAIEAVHKRFGFRVGAKKWQVYAEQQERRALWARNLFNGENDIADLSTVNKTGKKTKERKPPKESKSSNSSKNKAIKASGAKVAPEIDTRSQSVPTPASGTTTSLGTSAGPRGTTAVPAAKMGGAIEVGVSEEDDEAAMAAFMQDEIDYDEIEEEVGEEVDSNVREEGVRWIATKEELAIREAAEALLSPEELAAKADEWSEHIDPMTENVFWVHDETLEQSMTMPGALKMRIKLKEEADKVQADKDEALRRMQKAMGNTGAKGKALFKKKR